MKCKACGGKQYEYGVVGSYKIYKCGSCGLGETEDKSLPDYTDYHRDSTYLKESAQFRNIFVKRWQIVNKFVSSGKILEIGSSVGTLLSIFKDSGWQVLGIEPSARAAKEAVKREIPTKVETFEKIDLKEGEYDVTVFNHVLEHVDNPKQVLEKAFKVLKRGGIVLVDVPNFGGIRSKLEKTNWGYLYPNEHKWHFTKESLSRLMLQSGFEIIHSETRSGIWDYGDPQSEIWQSLAGFKRRFFKNILFLIPDYLVSVLGQGSGLTVVGRKK